MKVARKTHTNRVKQLPAPKGRCAEPKAQDSKDSFHMECGRVKAHSVPVQRIKYDVANNKTLEIAGHTTPLLTTVLFLSDLDGTWLSPIPANRKALDEGVVELKQEVRAQGVDLQFGYISARPLQRIMQEGLPASDWAVANNGGYVYQSGGSDRASAQQDSDWEARKGASGFSADKAFEAAQEVLAEPQFANLSVTSVGKVVGNPAADACPSIASLCIHNDSIDFAANESPAQLQSETFSAPHQVEEFAHEVSAKLEAEGAHFKLSPVYPFHGKPYVMFDLASVDKGDAIAYLRDKNHLPADHVIIAGDGGNDIAMMLDEAGKDDGRRAIVVGGNSKLRLAAANLNRAIVQNPDEDCSLGVLDGLRQHLGEIVAQVAAQ